MVEGQLSAMRQSCTDFERASWSRTSWSSDEIAMALVRQPPLEDRPLEGELEPHELVAGLPVDQLRQVARP